MSVGIAARLSLAHVPALRHSSERKPDEQLAGQNAGQNGSVILGTSAPASATGANGPWINLTITACPSCQRRQACSWRCWRSAAAGAAWWAWRCSASWVASPRCPCPCPPTQSLARRPCWVSRSVGQSGMDTCSHVEDSSCGWTGQTTMYFLGKASEALRMMHCFTC